MVNRHCFAGRQSFGNGFRALVAGGGTGDGTIFLAERLRHTNAQIVHLDMSGASLAIARERAALYQLGNTKAVLPPLDRAKVLFYWEQNRTR